MLPLHHLGMEAVLPIGARLPRAGHHVSVLFGEAHDARAGLAQRSLDAITAWIEQQLRALEAAHQAPSAQGSGER